jgi:hypothetical protein
MLRVILFSAAYLVYSKGSRGITDVCTWHIHRSQRPPTYTRTCHIMHLLSMHASPRQARQKHAMSNKWSDQHAYPFLSSTSRRLHVLRRTKGYIFISW